MIIHRAFDEVFRSWSHVAVLRAIRDTAVGLTGNQVARAAGMQPRSALRALTSLEQLGIVRRQRGGRDHLFTLNRDHFLVSRGIIPLYDVEEKLLSAISSAIEKSAKGWAVSVILFGSVARKEERASSDFDLCCIVRSESQKKDLQRKLDSLSSKLYKQFGARLSPLYFSLQEFRNKIESGNPLARQIVEEGRVIVGKGVKELSRG